jgi:hypothetical protein
LDDHDGRQDENEKIKIAVAVAQKCDKACVMLIASLL